ncbi:MAG: hypothetical protein JJE51_09425 [Thermoanaerobaculia bacterium]|nr:hypothetical protein [Thermoanaerobaculia bacterium]
MASVADDLSREQLERFAKMTVSERVALSERLGEEALAAFMSANHLDRESALKAIRRSRRIGRRPSACADEKS